MSLTNFLQTLIQLTRRTFERFLNKIDTTMPADSITINEFKEVFFPLKTSKSSGYDNINSNVIKIALVNELFPINICLKSP